GRRLIDPARRTAAAAEEARASVRRHEAPTGLLVVSMPTAVGIAGAGELASSLVDAHRGLRIDLRLEDQTIDLLAEGVDVAIRAGLAAPDSTMFVARRLV